MMPNRHSLFWRLALVLVAFFLLRYGCPGPGDVVPN